MTPWVEIIAAAVGVLTALGAGMRWLLTWLVAQIKANQDAFIAALGETEKRFATALATKDARIDAERDARLADQRQHTEDMREMLDGFQETLRRVRVTSTVPPPKK